MFDLVNARYDAADSNSVSVKSKVETIALIVIPCYNEESRLNSDSFLGFLKQHADIKFLFVNDGSKDRTIDVLHNMALKNPKQVQVLDLKKNGGKAEAVRLGMLHAMDSDARFVGYWDADLATPLNAITDFLNVTKRLPEIEVIYGSRKALLGHRISRTFSRRIVSRTCALLARFATRLPVNDTQCGAKIFANTEALNSAFQSKFTAGWLFDVELFARLAHKIDNVDGKFFEYPLLEWTEIPGSKIGLKSIILSGFSMLRLIGEMRLGLRV